jgi:hypothetical protein
MSGQNGEFGKRRQEAEPARTIARPARPAGRGIPPLIKQIGGMAFGVALVLALAAFSAHSKRQMGKALDQHFSEQKAGIEPQPEIQIRDERAMRSAIQTCTIGANGACQ